MARVGAIFKGLRVVRICRYAMAALEDGAPRAPHEEYEVFESEEFPGLAGLDATKLAEAETAIRKCLDIKSASLDLTRLNLVTLPGPTIGGIKHLVELKCSCNRLTELPSELGKCSKLELVSCSFNRVGPIQSSCAAGGTSASG